MSWLPLATVAWGSLALVFLGFYFVARRLDNYGIVDIVWSYAFGLVAVLYGLLGPGWPVRRAALAIIATLWSLRLGTHLFHRVMSHHPVEDGRYQQLRRDWQGVFAAKMAGFFQLQALSVVVISVPYLLVCRNLTPHFAPVEWAALLLWVVAILGEAAADRQLAAFSRANAGRKAVCQAGWWRYSRHPNYFFEWLNWVSYFIFALAAPGGGWGLIGPASILFLLLRVTGIPMTEQQSLRSRGDAYRRYQQTTSAFIPWFPREGGHD